MKTLTRGSEESFSATPEAIELARSIPARVTVCFVWLGIELIAVGCDEEGYRGLVHAREQRIVSGNVVGKSFMQLRRERAQQLRSQSQEQLESSPLAELLEMIELAREELNISKARSADR